jgi:hypothetical protein
METRRGDRSAPSESEAEGGTLSAGFQSRAGSREIDQCPAEAGPYMSRSA